MKQINKKISLINFNDSNRSASQIKYLVIHYVGAVSTAANNANYFYSAYRGASAHFFVDENEIWQIVEENDTAWHCGTNGAYYSDCRNSNSLSIEMCVKNNGQWYFEDATVQNTIELAKYLCDKYGIDRNHVIRHYDVTHKICPEPYVRNENAWNEFKDAIFNSGNAQPSNPTPVPQPSQTEGYTVRITTAVLNVRNEPNTNSNINTQVRKNEVYTIVAEQGNWGKLKSGAGWICLDYTEKTSAATVPSQPVVKTMKVTAKSGLNVRNSPGGTKVGAISYDSTVNVTEESNGWSKIGEGKWVSSQYLAGTTSSTPAPSTSIKKGDIVRIKSNAQRYVTGQTIPSRYKNQAYIVMQKGDGKSLLQQIMSWVYDSDLTK